MDVILRPIFSVLTVPDLKIKQPTWLHVSIFFTSMKSTSLTLFQTPPAWTIFAFILTTYFLVTGGIIYDVIVEPPRLSSVSKLKYMKYDCVMTLLSLDSVGSTTDEHGHTRPVAFMPYRVNGQYIMEVNTDIFIVL